jgi:hypothetical protein
MGPFRGASMPRGLEAIPPDAERGEARDYPWLDAAQMLTAPSTA